ncbi:MAG: hypothetical protein MUC65_07800, partial [Pontiellaceae bacterium]|nr:hypothetical protein [Pontiellaceae bacterium]
MNIRQNGSKITAVCAIVLACTAFHVHAATLYVNGTNSTPSAPFTSWETAADLPNNWTPLQPEIQRPSTIHISQTAQGNDTGVDAVNAHSAAWFNTASNWNSSTDLTDGMIGPGDVVEFHGIITTRLTVQESGTAGDGNSIQITFADDAMMYVPTLPDNINIPERERTQLDLSYRDYITLMNVTLVNP